MFKKKKSIKISSAKIVVYRTNLIIILCYCHVDSFMHPSALKLDVHINTILYHNII